MILTQAQAEAVYSAMCTLNNVDGRITCSIQAFITVKETFLGHVYVSHMNREGLERYDNQAAFATAYGLQ